MYPFQCSRARYEISIWKNIDAGRHYDCIHTIWIDGVKVELGNRGMTVEAAWRPESEESPGTYVTERV